MKITICIGSSCHLKGSRKIVEELQRLIAENNAEDQVELAGQFCIRHCYILLVHFRNRKHNQKDWECSANDFCRKDLCAAYAHFLPQTKP